MTDSAKVNVYEICRPGPVRRLNTPILMLSQAARTTSFAVEGADDYMTSFGVRDARRAELLAARRRLCSAKPAPL